MTLELAMIVDSCVGLPSSAVMVPMVNPFFFCWNFVLLPLHKYSGNEADDDLMMESILPSIVYCSRCRISND